MAKQLTLVHGEASSIQHQQPNPLTPNLIDSQESHRIHRLEMAFDAVTRDHVASF
jgi:hypothetical protein